MRIGTGGLLVGLAAFLAVVPGCIIVSEAPEAGEAPMVALPEGKYTGAIRAAQAIDFSSERTHALREVAGKPDLEEVDQHRLVYLLRRDGAMSSEKTEVVLALIANPNTTVATKSMIGSYTKDLAEFSSDRARIAQALSN